MDLVPFLAMIVPVAQPPGQQPPPQIWGGGNQPFPTNPIAGFNPGTGTWPTPPQQQPPLGIWGPGDPRPTNPITGFNPGSGTFPPGQPPQPPLIMWGPGDSRPTLPIAGFDPGSGTFPGGGGGGGGGDGEKLPKFDMKAAWSPSTGWVTVFIPSSDSTAPVPTPSSGGGEAKQPGSPEQQ